MFLTIQTYGQPTWHKELGIDKFDEVYIKSYQEDILIIGVDTVQDKTSFILLDTNALETKAHYIIDESMVSFKEFGGRHYGLFHDQEDLFDTTHLILFTEDITGIEKEISIANSQHPTLQIREKELIIVDNAQYDSRYELFRFTNISHDFIIKESYFIPWDTYHKARTSTKNGKDIFVVGEKLVRGDTNLIFVMIDENSNRQVSKEFTSDSISAETLKIFSLNSSLLVVRGFRNRESFLVTIFSLEGDVLSNYAIEIPQEYSIHQNHFWFDPIENHLVFAMQSGTSTVISQMDLNGEILQSKEFDFLIEDLSIVNQNVYVLWHSNHKYAIAKFDTKNLDQSCIPSLDKTIQTKQHQETHKDYNPVRLETSVDTLSQIHEFLSQEDVDIETICPRIYALGSTDTTICKYDSAQFQVAGDESYKWYNSSDSILSSTDNLFLIGESNTDLKIVGYHGSQLLYSVAVIDTGICDKRIEIDTQICKGDSILFFEKDQELYFEYGEIKRPPNSDSSYLVLSESQIIKAIGLGSFEFSIKVEISEVEKCARSLSFYGFITPNNDQLNDVFYVENAAFHAPIEFIVFDFDDQLVYQNQDYKNDWGGDDLPSGQYNFIVRSAKENHQGKLLIKR